MLTAYQILYSSVQAKLNSLRFKMRMMKNDLATSNNTDFLSNITILMPQMELTQNRKL